MKLGNAIQLAILLNSLTFSATFADSHEKLTNETDCKEHSGTWDSKEQMCKVKKAEHDHDDKDHKDHAHNDKKKK